MSKLFVGNLNFNVTDSTLEMFIKECGVESEEVNIIRDRFTGRSRGFGFIQLTGEQDLDEAISVLNGKNLESRALRVDRAQERKDRTDGGGGGGGGDRGNW